MPFGLNEIFEVLGQPTLWILLPILFVQFIGDRVRSKRKSSSVRDGAPRIRDRH